MKRLFSLMLAAVMVCSMLTVSCFAVPETDEPTVIYPGSGNYVASPEYPEVPEEPEVEILEEDVPLIDIPEEDVPLVDIPDEDVPLVDILDEEVPLAPLPLSPQTGEAFGVLWIAAAAVLFGAVAVVSMKKVAE